MTCLCGDTRFAVGVSDPLSSSPVPGHGEWLSGDRGMVIESDCSVTPLVSGLSIGVLRSVGGESKRGSWRDGRLPWEVAEYGTEGG